MRIVYLGTPEFAVPPLRRLVESGYNVVAVVTAPDKPAGRGLEVQKSEVKRYAEKAGLRVLQPENLKDEDFVASFRALRPDLGIVVAFRMLPEVIWKTPRLGTFNLHASLLPQYRGAAPINWAIINGEKSTGLTTFMLNHEIDKGSILARLEVKIGPDDNFGDLYERLMILGPGMVEQTVDMISAGAVRPVPQNTIAAGVLKPAPKIFRETCRIEWNSPGERIHDFIRGLSPHPGAWSRMMPVTAEISDPVMVKIFAASFTPDTHNTLPGNMDIDRHGRFRVTCPDGYIIIDELQMAGKKRMTAYEFLRGFSVNSFVFEI